MAKNKKEKRVGAYERIVPKARKSNERKPPGTKPEEQQPLLNMCLECIHLWIMGYDKSYKIKEEHLYRSTRWGEEVYHLPYR